MGPVGVADADDEVEVIEVDVEARDEVDDDELDNDGELL